MNFANGGPNTNAAQWCIMLGDRSYLDGDYIVFGNVVEGMDVVFSIAPEDGVTASGSYAPGTRQRRSTPTRSPSGRWSAAAEARVAEHEVLKAQAEEEWIQQNHPDLEGPEGGVRFRVLSPGTGVRPADRHNAGEVTGHPGPVHGAPPGL